MTRSAPAEAPIRPFDGKPVRWLLLMYLIGVATRWVLSLVMSANPFVMPDEALYANIARSIAGGFGVTLRNQPVTYTSLLYPLLIAPAYLLDAGRQFRAIQLINCVVMNLAVFPAYGIAKSVTGDRRRALFIAAAALLLPDMVLTTRIMTEALTYPLFLLVVYLMNGKLAARRARPMDAVRTGAAAFLLFAAKSGAVALAAAFLGILLWGFIRRRDREDLKYAGAFAGAFLGLVLLVWLALALTGMDFSWKSVYQTQMQAPTLEHLKKTLPGLLLYAFFIPVAFGIYPLLLPTSNLRSYDDAGRRLACLAFVALVLVAAGACYLFFDSETAGDFFAGRIHIRYVFMFLPVFLALAWSPRLEGARPNGKLLAALGFLLAMTVTVSFSALLSGRRYPVDAISLSYIVHDDAALNWEYLSQIAFVAFAAAMLALIWRRGWGIAARRACAACLALGLVTANTLGYDLNAYNNSKALRDDAAQGAGMLAGGGALLVPEGGIWFDNTLTVLDTAMADAPYAALLEDVCAALGPYGELKEFAPGQYWAEKPARPVPAVARIAFNASAMGRVVPAAGASVAYTANGMFAVMTPGADRRLFHSALAGLPASGLPGTDTALWVYDEATLRQGAVRVYLQVRCASACALALTANGQTLNYDLNASSDWIYGDFAVPAGMTALKVDIRTAAGEMRVITYRIK
jgi:hypothetical protein